MIRLLDRVVARGLMVVNAGLRRFNRWLRERTVDRHVPTIDVHDPAALGLRSGEVGDVIIEGQRLRARLRPLHRHLEPRYVTITLNVDPAFHDNTAAMLTVASRRLRGQGVRIKEGSAVVRNHADGHRVTVSYLVDDE